MNTKLLFALAFALLSNLMSAQAIDTTFGINGSLNQNNLGSFYGPTITPDGKIISPGLFKDGGDYKASLLKMNTDGTLDSTFGVNGKFEMNLFASEDYYEDFVKATVLSNGKILVIYYYEFDNGIDESVDGTKLVRLNADGTLDNTFNNPMIVGNNNFYIDYEILSNDKILAITLNSMRRILSDGSLDSSYGTSGIRTLGFNLEQIFINSSGIFLNDYDGQRFVKLDNESSVTISSFSTGNYFSGDIKMHNDHFFIPSYNNSIAKYTITKINSNLVPDPSFGANGIFTVPQTSNYSVVGIQENGSLLSGTNTYDAGTNTYKLLLQRINPNGVADLTFGTQGLFTHSTTGEYYSDFFYHPILKKMYTRLEDQNNLNNAVVSRFNIPNEILAVQNIYSKNKVRIIENPVRDVLKLSSILKNVVLYNAVGSKVGNSFYSQDLSVDQLTTGVYIISGEDEQGNLVKLKFIKE